MPVVCDTVRTRWLLWALGAASVTATVVRALFLAHVPHQTDIDVYLLGGRHVFSPSLYTVRSAWAGLPFLYPPFAGLLFLPLDAFTAGTAQLIWAVGNAGTLVAFTILSVHAVRPDLPRRTAVAWGAVLVFPAYLLQPVHLNFDLGQINIMLVALIFFDLTTSRRIGRWTVPEGVATGIAAAIKLTPLIFVPYLWMVGRRRSAGRLTGTFAAIAAAMFVLSPGASWAYWTKDAYQADKVGVAFTSDQNVTALAIRLNHAMVSNLVLLPILAVIGVAGLALAIWAHRVSSPVLGILVCGVTGLLVSPISWSHHMVWVVPGLLWLVVGADRPRFGWLWALGGTWLFWRAPIWWVPHAALQGYHEHGWGLLEGNSYLLALVVFMVGVAVMLWRRTARAGVAAVAERVEASP